MFFMEGEEGGFGLPFYFAEEGGEEAGGWGSALAGDVDEGEGGGGVQGAEGARGGEGVVEGYFDVFPELPLELGYLSLTNGRKG
jgi:hypothetical protein